MATASTVVNRTGQGTGTVTDAVRSDDELAGRRISAQLDVTAASGTTPTLNVKFQHSVDGTNWDDLTPAFAQKTAAGREVITLPNTHGGNLRVSSTVAGTTPSFTFTVKIIVLPS